MTDQLISFETAKLAKKKELHIPESNYAYFNGKLQRCSGQVYSSNERCEAPTQSLLQKWLREEHSIDIIIEPNANEIQKYYCWRIRKNMEPAKWGNVTNTFEEALEAGLQQTLKLIK